MPGATRRGARTTARPPRSPTIYLTTYPFGVEEHQYDSSGNSIGTSTYYYTFAGKLIGVLLGTTMEFVLTDDLGSVRTAITNQVGVATVAGYMGYGPFGFLQYHAGQTGTNKGYTGQYTDPLSGLDDYVARYYDPVVGLFLSADTVQSTLQGFDPYAYVGNNPETLNDPSGQRYTTQAGYNYGAWGGIGPVSTESQAWILPNDTMVINDYLPAPYGIQTQVVTLPQRHVPAYNPLTDPNNSPGAKFAHVTGWDTLHSTLTNPKATTTDKVKAVGAFALKNVNNALQLAMIFGGDGVGDAGEEGVASLFYNQYPERLLAELESAEQLGVKPLQVDDAGFQEMIQNGPVKWVVSESGQLAFVPKFVRGTEIYHSVITGGEPVLAAGEAEIYNDGRGYVASMFSRWSGHYLPDEASEIIGRNAFIRAGIRFPPPILGLKW